MKDATVSLANLVTAFKAQPSEDALPWNDRSELQELFGLFCSRFELEKQAVLQKVGRSCVPVRQCCCRLLLLHPVSTAC